MENQYIITVHVENKSGVLSKISGLFASRGYNINSLTVGETEDKNISRMTIVVSGDDSIIEQVVKQTHKVIETIKVNKYKPEKVIAKELCFIKVNFDSKSKYDIIAIATSHGGSIVDFGDDEITIEICDETEKISNLIGKLDPYKIVEVAKSGTVAIKKN